MINIRLRDEMIGNGSTLLTYLRRAANLKDIVLFPQFDLLPFFTVRFPDMEERSTFDVFTTAGKLQFLLDHPEPKVLIDLGNGTHYCQVDARHTDNDVKHNLSKLKPTIKDSDIEEEWHDVN